MFKLNKDEFHELVTNCDRSNTLKHSSVMPNAFTEQGVSMLSAVLRSPAAIQVSIRIIESFVRLRKLALYNTSILQRLDIRKHNAQYKPISILSYSKAHDRFLIIDDNVYLIGASIKDLGKKWFGFTLIQGISANDICEKLQREA